MKNNKKPFGLTISANIAAKAIHANVAPASTVLCNMFYLQKDPYFPKELDISFFSINRYTPQEIEKKQIISILDAFKQPNTNMVTVIESAFEKGWVRKSLPNEPSPPQKIERPKRKIKKPQLTTEPTVTIKKNKLS